MSTIYRIYTEDLNRDKVLALVGEHFVAYTVLTGTGAWEDKLEDSLVIEIIQDTEADQILQAIDSSVFLLAARIKNMNRQDSVLVTKQPIETFSV